MSLSEINPAEFLATLKQQLQAIETTKSRIQEADDKILLLVNEKEKLSKDLLTDLSKYAELSAQAITALSKENRKIEDEKATLEIDNNKLREDKDKLQSLFVEMKSLVVKAESTGQENRPPTPTTQSPSALTAPTNDSSNVAVTAGTTEIVAADSDSVMKVSAAGENEQEGDTVVCPSIMGSRVEEESFVPSSSNTSNIPTPTRGCALVLDDLDEASIDTPVTRNADDSDSNDDDDDDEDMDDSSGDVVDNMEFLQKVDLENFSSRRPRKYRGTLLTTPTPRNVIGGLTSSSSPLRLRFQSVAPRHNKGASFSSTVTGDGGGFVTPARHGGFVTPVTGPSNSNSNGSGGEDEAIPGQQHQVEPNGEGNNLVQPTWEELTDLQKSKLIDFKERLTRLDFPKHIAEQAVGFSISDDLWNNIPKKKSHQPK